MESVYSFTREGLSAKRGRVVLAAVFRLAWRRKLRTPLGKREKTCSEEAAFENSQGLTLELKQNPTFSYDNINERKFLKATLDLLSSSANVFTVGKAGLVSDPFLWGSSGCVNAQFIHQLFPRLFAASELPVLVIRGQHCFPVPLGNTAG